MTDLSPGIRTILTEGVRALEPSQAARERIRAGVAARIAVVPGAGGAGDSGSAAGGATTGGAATGALGASGIVKATLLTFVGVIVVGGSAVWFATGDRAPAETAARAPALAAPAAPADETAAKPSASQAGTMAPAAAQPPRASSGRAASRSTAARRRDSAPDRASQDDRVAASTAADLAREVQLLDRARRAIAASDPDAARAVLSRYRREIRAPQMEREALLLQAEAQCAAARTDDGLRTLDEVDARWPGASGVATVRALCGAAPR